jgi:antitoxin ParD1/3/4
VPSTYTLGEHFELFIQAQLASGRYAEASEVIHEALRLLEERERKLVSLDAMIESAMLDIETGNVRDLDDVCDELLEEIANFPDHPSV